MKSILDRYLDRVLVYANKSESESEAIRKELKDHLLQKIDDLKELGLPREDATLEALQQHGSPKVVGYGLRGAFPWIDIRSHGTARGVIAIGPKAVGVFAFGGVAIGVVACGTFSIGIFSAGFLAIGGLIAWGFLALGGIAAAFVAVGGVAAGAVAIGLVASGDRAYGEWVPPVGHGPGICSFYEANNVPPCLRVLESVLNGCISFERHAITIGLPIYLLLVLMLGYFQHLEKKRVEPAEDWLIDG